MDPNARVIVITPTDKYRDLAKVLNLDSVEPAGLGLDPAQVYKEGVLGRR